MEIEISADGWTAELVVSPLTSVDDGAGFLHCMAAVLGKTEADALRGAQAVLDLFAKGREAFIRVAPVASTDKEFDTKQVKYRGCVRFSVKLEAGRWHSPTETPHLVPPGLSGL